MRTSAQISPPPQHHAGYTLIELLVALALSSLAIGGLLQQYSTSLRISADEQTRTFAAVRAQAVLESLGAELRVLGNGVPYDQSNFQIGESTLSNPSVTHPIDLSSKGDVIIFRLNETGDVHLLTGDFDPGATLTLALTSTAGLSAGDAVYISNSVVGGDDGLAGTIASVSGNSITLAASPVRSPAATFNMGSVLERVPAISYSSSAEGIFRDAGLGPVLMAPRGALTFEYLNADGVVLALPLTETALIQELRRIRVTIAVEADRELSDGSTHTATLTQTYSLRNLNTHF